MKKFLEWLVYKEGSDFHDKRNFVTPLFWIMLICIPFIVILFTNII